MGHTHCLGIDTCEIKPANQCSFMLSNIILSIANGLKPWEMMLLHTVKTHGGGGGGGAGVMCVVVGFWMFPMRMDGLLFVSPRI